MAARRFPRPPGYDDRGKQPVLVCQRRQQHECVACSDRRAKLLLPNENDHLGNVGAESGDFVPIRFRTESEVGATILAECADEDLCESKGTVPYLDYLPPEDASAVGEIIGVDYVTKLPPDTQ